MRRTLTEVSEAISDQDIRQYMNEGGVLFHVVKIDMIRDGGTLEVTTSISDPLYVSKDRSSIHSGYPISEDNKIENDLRQRYIINRIEHFVVSQEEDSVRCRKYLTQLTGNLNH